MTARAAAALVVFLGAWIAVNLVTRFTIDPRAIQHDQALYVECGVRLVRGELPYRDFFELNPPLIIYLNAIPAAAARIARVNPIPVFTIAVALLSGWSAWAAVRHARRKDALSPLEWLAIASVPLGPFAVTAAQQMDAGQREHLFALFYFPMFVLRVARAEGWSAPRPWAAIVTGFVAGCGVCLKPHLLLPVACVELIVLIRTRSLRTFMAPEIAGLGLFAAGYAGHFLVWPAEMREGFFGRVVPVVSSGYSAFDSPMPMILRAVGKRIILGIALTGVAFALARAQMRAFVVPAFTVAAATLAAAIVQHKGFNQHYLPANGMFGFLAVIALDGIVERTRLLGPAVFRAVTACAAAAVLLPVFAWPAVHQRRTVQTYVLKPFVERHTKPGNRVAVITGTVTTAFPTLMQTDRTLVGRHLWGFLFVLARRAEELGLPSARAEQQRYLEDSAADIERFQPDAVFVHDAVSAYIGSNPRLEAAMSAYRRAAKELDVTAYVRSGR